MKRLILFDLDDTLVVEGAAAAAAFRATAEVAAATRRDVDPDTLAGRAREAARDLWYASAVHEYCMRIGISSWEGLWCRFEGVGDELAWLRGWAPAYRLGTWRAALADQGVDDERLALLLAEHFAVERRRRHETFPDAREALERLRGRHVLGVVTNGASCLQREKLETSGLQRYFDLAVVSAEAGVAKPEPGIFEQALALAGVRAADALMVGDSFGRDVEGAIGAGLDAVWLNRTARERPGGGAEVVEISALNELPALRR